MGHWLVDVHLAVFAPAFTLSQGDSEAPANRQMPIALALAAGRKKKERRNLTARIGNNLNKQG